MKITASIFASLALAAVIAGAATQRGIVPGVYKLCFVDRDGKAIEDAGTLPSNTFAPRISPDGRRVAYDRANDGRESVISIYELFGEHATRTLPPGGQNLYPMWSSDGTRLLFMSTRDGEPAIYWQRADGTGAAERLTPFARSPESFSAVNERFSYITAKGADYDVWSYSFHDKKATPLVEIAGSAQHSSAFSPDGRWIAYMSEETGKQQVFVQPFPTTGEKFQITQDGGTRPLWSPDGKELFYDNNAGRMFVVSVQPQPKFTAGKATALPITGFIQGPLRRQYDITSDGKRFLMMFPPDR